VRTIYHMSKIVPKLLNSWSYAAGGKTKVDPGNQPACQLGWQRFEDHYINHTSIKSSNGAMASQGKEPEGVSIRYGPDVQMWITKNTPDVPEIHHLYWIVFLNQPDMSRCGIHFLEQIPTDQWRTLQGAGSSCHFSFSHRLHHPVTGDLYVDYCRTHKKWR
jgi:hypothetical protein